MKKKKTIKKKTKIKKKRNKQHILCDLRRGHQLQQRLNGDNWIIFHKRRQVPRRETSDEYQLWFGVERGQQRLLQRGGQRRLECLWHQLTHLPRNDHQSLSIEEVIECLPARSCARACGGCVCVRHKSYRRVHWNIGPAWQRACMWVCKRMSA